MSNSTKELVAFSIYNAEKGCLSEKNNHVKLTHYQHEHEHNKKVFHHNAIDYLNSLTKMKNKENEKKKTKNKIYKINIKLTTEPPTIASKSFNQDVTETQTIKVISLQNIIILVIIVCIVLIIIVMIFGFKFNWKMFILKLKTITQRAESPIAKTLTEPLLSPTPAITIKIQLSSKQKSPHTPRRRSTRRSA